MRLLGINAFVSLPIILIFFICDLQAEEKCKKELIATNDNIVICAKEGLRQVDSVLNEEYRTLMAGLEGRRKQELIYTQKIWLKYRDGTVMPTMIFLILGRKLQEINYCVWHKLQEHELAK